MEAFPFMGCKSCKSVLSRLSNSCWRQPVNLIRSKNPNNPQHLWTFFPEVVFFTLQRKLIRVKWKSTKHTLLPQRLSGLKQKLFHAFQELPINVFCVFWIFQQDGINFHHIKGLLLWLLKILLHLCTLKGKQSDITKRFSLLTGVEDSHILYVSFSGAFNGRPFNTKAFTAGTLMACSPPQIWEEVCKSALIWSFSPLYLDYSRLVKVSAGQKNPGVFSRKAVTPLHQWKSPQWVGIKWHYCICAGDTLSMVLWCVSISLPYTAWIQSSVTAGYFRKCWSFQRAVPICVAITVPDEHSRHYPEALCPPCCSCRPLTQPRLVAIRTAVLRMRSWTMARWPVHIGPRIAEMSLV